MSLFKKLFKYFTCREYRFTINSNRKIFNILPDKLYLKMLYHNFYGKKLNLKNPQTLCEKLQYLKLYDRNPLYTKMVDKYESKNFIASLVGEEYIIPSYGVWDSFDDIDFDKLPDSFILKCTHNSGCYAICNDKNNFDKELARKNLTEKLKTNYFYSKREWPYKMLSRE